MITFVALLNAVAAIPKIAAIVEQIASGFILWYVQRAQSATLASIADAAAMSARAKTEEERYASTDAWQKALSRPRVSA